MIITLSGPPGSGTSTVGKIVAKKLDLKFLPVGEIFRQMAKEKGLSLEEFSSMAEKDPSVDKEVDIRQVEEANKGKVVFDSRLSGWLVRNADLKVWLKAPLDVRLKRVAQRDKISEQRAFIDVTLREGSEKKRYKNYYDIDLDDLSVYDLVIDTSKWNADQVAELIEKAVTKK